MKMTVLLGIVFLLFRSLVDAQVSSVKLSTYQKGNYNISVYQSDMGGGGYITGILQYSRNSIILVM